MALAWPKALQCGIYKRRQPVPGSTAPRRPNNTPIKCYKEEMQERMCQSPGAARLPEPTRALALPASPYQMPTPDWAPGPFPSLEALPSMPSVAPGATAEDTAAADSDQTTADLTMLLGAGRQLQVSTLVPRRESRGLTAS